MWMSREEMKKLFSFAETSSPLTRLLFSAKECEGWLETLSGPQPKETKDREVGRHKILGKTAVLYLVFALGLLYAPSPDACESNDARAVGLMECALRLMRMKMLAEEGGIFAVQAFGLATVVCLTVRKRHAAWIHLGTMRNPFVQTTPE